jgi:hypothetical protein
MRVTSTCENCGEEFEQTGTAPSKGFGTCKWCGEEYCPMCGKDGMHFNCEEKADSEGEERDFNKYDEDEEDDGVEEYSPLGFNDIPDIDFEDDE